MNRITPIFPCLSLDELLAFYQSIGFEVTYYQKSPNPYAVVEKDWIRLDFYGVKYHDPQKVFHTCYITTDEVDELYEHFSDALRSRNGKLPTRGLPRISDIRDKPQSGVREFQLVDIAGTYLRFGKKLDTPPDADKQSDGKTVQANNRLSLALDFAYKLEGEADELEQVSKLLDKAIAKEKMYPCINLYKVMMLRADVAIAGGAYDLAGALLQEVKESTFMTDKKEKYKAEWRRLSDLGHKLVAARQEDAS